MNLYKMKSHPIANHFPLLVGDEMAALVASVKANGVIHPVTISGDLIIDGRNRIEAAKKAGIAQSSIPYKELNGIDPKSFIVSQNLVRRNLEPGQRALIYATARPNKSKGGRGLNRFASMPAGKETMANAYALVEAGDMADGLRKRVMALPDNPDHMFLKAAAAELKELKHKALWAGPRKAELRDKAPDLFERLTRGTLDIGKTWVLYQQRLKDQKRDRQIRARNFGLALHELKQYQHEIQRIALIDLITEYKDEFAAHASTPQHPCDTESAVRMMGEIIEGLTEAKDSLMQRCARNER